MWEQLTMSERSQALKNARAKGITDLQEVERMVEEEAQEQAIADEMEQASYAQNTDASENNFENSQNDWNNVAAYRNEFINQTIAKQYAYGGPIKNWAMIQYHFKHNKTPEEVNRIRYKGPFTNKVDWDNTPEGRLINYSENRDSVGYIPSSHRWVAPDKPGYDKNNRGMGVDINTNPYVKKYLKQDSKGNSYLTEADEKLIRYKSIQDAEDSYRRRLEYAQSKIGSANVPSIKKKAATMSAIYNLGSAKVANTIFENKDAMNALLNGTDDEYINYINNEYKKRGRNERVKLQNEFNNYKYGGHLFLPGGNTGSATGPDDPEELARQLRAAVDDGYRGTTTMASNNTRVNTPSVQEIQARNQIAQTNAIKQKIADKDAQTRGYNSAAEEKAVLDYNEATQGTVSPATEKPQGQYYVDKSPITGSYVGDALTAGLALQGIFNPVGTAGMVIGGGLAGESLNYGIRKASNNQLTGWGNAVGTLLQTDPKYDAAWNWTNPGYFIGGKYGLKIGNYLKDQIFTRPFEETSFIKTPNITAENAASITPKVTHFYHGSPVRFDTFSADFIGSGEGGSKVMRGINLWLPEKIGNAPKFANIKSPDAPLHLGVSSIPLGGELNPTIYDVSGSGLKLYTASPREVKSLNQSDLISQGYDGIQTPNQVTIFPESIGKLSIDRQYTIEEFVRAHPEVDKWTPWTTDNQKMQNIIDMSRMSKWTPEQWTAAQDAAIARGDMAEAQRLRDLHFGLSNSKYKQPLFRGTDENSPIMDFSKMQVHDVPAVYLTPHEAYARGYGANVRKLYLNTQNPWIDKFGKDYSKFSVDQIKKRLDRAVQKGDNAKIEKYKEILNDIEGTDAAYRYYIDGTNGDLTKIYEGTPPEILGKDVNKIKLYDAVAYDDNGVRVPLGERDNFGVNDVRFSKNPDFEDNIIFEEMPDPSLERSNGLKVFKEIPEEFKEDIEHMTKPRMTESQRKAEMPTEYYEYDGMFDQTRGRYDPKDRSVGVSYGEQDYALGHEIRHFIDDTEFGKLTQEQYDILKKAYGDLFIDMGNDPSIYGERVTANYDLRRILLKEANLDRASLAEQNEYLKNVTTTQLYNAMQKEWYTKKYLNALLTNPEYTKNNYAKYYETLGNIKKAMITVPSVVGVTAPLISTNQE